MNIKEIETELIELRQAVGLATTMHPTLVMDSEHPLDMMLEIVAHVDSIKDELAEAQRQLAEWRRIADDRRTRGLAAEAERDALRVEVERLKTCCTIEAMLSNLNVDSYIQERDKIIAELKNEIEINIAAIEYRDNVIDAMKNNLKHERADLAAAVEVLRILVNYTESCEGLLNASPAGQVKNARALLARMEVK